jgi:hypothetical protein
VSIVNRRNAIMGWAAWAVAKTFLKEKVLRQKPTPPPTIADRAKSRKAIVAYALAAGTSVLVFLRLRRGGEE